MSRVCCYLPAKEIYYIDAFNDTHFLIDVRDSHTTCVPSGPAPKLTLNGTCEWVREMQTLSAAVERLMNFPKCFDNLCSTYNICTTCVLNTCFICKFMRKGSSAQSAMIFLFFCVLIRLWHLSDFYEFGKFKANFISGPPMDGSLLLRRIPKDFTDKAIKTGRD